MKADRVEERCCRMAPHGDSLCDDVLLCLIAQPGRQAACAKPFNGPCGQGALLVAQATKPLNGPCGIQYSVSGQGALLVAQAIATHMPCELWLHYCIEKYAPRMGRSGRHSGCAHSTACSVRPYCVHVRKRDKNCGMQRS